MLGSGTADHHHHHRVVCPPNPSSTTSAGPFRIFSVAGFQNRTNDIVYCPPIIRQQQSTQNVEEDSTAVVYFGGDVQVTIGRGRDNVQRIN